MGYKLKTGEDESDAAFELLGDRRLTNEIHVIDGTAYLKAEKAGPPTKWAGAPPVQKEDDQIEEE